MRGLRDIVCVFEFHQPSRLRPFRFLEVGQDADYFDETLDRELLERVADRCYGPVNALFGRLGRRFGERFEVGLSFTGTLLDQLEDWAPATLEAWRTLLADGRHELLCETSHHSLTYAADPDEFRLQVAAQRERLASLFGARPTTFRNTELIADEALVAEVEALGFEGLLIEGAERRLEGRSPAGAYTVGRSSRLRALPRSYALADDLAFRFSDPGWIHHPLSPETWVEWLLSVPGDAPVIGLFMDVETFGEHQAADTGVFAFFERAVELLLERSQVRLCGPGRALREAEPSGAIRFSDTVSWADADRSLGAWLGNPMQRAAFEALYRLGPRVRALAPAFPELVEHWRRLTTSDHLYYMSTASGPDGDVHQHFSPFPSPHDAHIAFMNVLADLKQRLETAESGGSPR